LKALAVRVRPIAICLPTYRDPNGFCNEALLSKEEPLNCFFLELRLVKRSPDLRRINIMGDSVIVNFIKASKCKFPRKTRRAEEESEEEGGGLNSVQFENANKVGEKGMAPSTIRTRYQGRRGVVREGACQTVQRGRLERQCVGE
jgi:hypothetical protein